MPRRITLTITNSEAQGDDQDLLTLDVYPEMTIETLRSSIQAETGHHTSAQHIYHNGNLISDNSKTLADLNIGDGEMLALHIREMRGSTTDVGPAPREERASRQNARQDPEMVRLQILGNPVMRAELARSQPEMAAAVDDAARFAQVYTRELDKEARVRADRVRVIQELNADPFNPENQERIAEMIRQERVMENLQNAMEHNPEGNIPILCDKPWRGAIQLTPYIVFGSVHMLYIDLEVNGHKFKALVDSGAQATIMSPTCAEACGIMRLVDRRFSGIARGVGSANIIGRVHSAQVKIGSQDQSLFLPCSFTVMEGKHVELLLGLDMLKRHQASIDLAKDKLIIQGVEIPFLGEADIPKESETALLQEPRVPGPAGTTIGQHSGAVSAPTGPAAAGPGPAPPVYPTPGAGPSQPPPQPPAQPANRFPREHIEQLMAIGASEQKAIQALEATGGNVEYAASLIFNID